LRQSMTLSKLLFNATGSSGRVRTTNIARASPWAGTFWAMVVSGEAAVCAAWRRRYMPLAQPRHSSLSSLFLKRRFVLVAGPTGIRGRKSCGKKALGPNLLVRSCWAITRSTTWGYCKWPDSWVGKQFEILNE
jgi:hypothetical protein